MCFATIAVSAIAGFVITYILSKKNKTQYGDASAEEGAEEGIPMTVSAVAKGTIIPMQEIPDDTFASGMLGMAIGIEPTEGKVYAPCSGTITHLADTLHAIGITIDDGVDILIHVGVDTVKMNGEGFSSKVKTGQKVKRSEVLLKMDLDKIHAAGYADTVITVIPGSEGYASTEVVVIGSVNLGQDIIKINK